MLQSSLAKAWCKERGLDGYERRNAEEFLIARPRETLTFTEALSLEAFQFRFRNQALRAGVAIDPSLSSRQLSSSDRFGAGVFTDMSYDGRNHRRDHNTHRSLRQLVAIEAWFRQSEDDESRYTLHANVSFDEERLGGGEGSNITFKLSVKRCEVVFLPPSSGYFPVDRSTVRFPKPLNPHSVQTTDTKTSRLGSGIRMALSGGGASGSGAIDASAAREKTSSITSNQEISPYHELGKRSHDGHRAWSLDGKSMPSQRLWGSVWNAEQEPRLTLTDRRTPEVIKKDEEMGFPPFSRMEVRCLREDIDIYDIQFKNEAEHGRIFQRPGQTARMKAAEAFLKQQILLEGLRVGDMTDRYSELTICDATIPITDASDIDS